MEIQTILSNLLKQNKLEPFIRYIRFPFYKNLDSNLRIDFSYPIVAIVGQNGTNKSSILRAIYGCPKDHNVGNFWFSTDLDPITEEKGRPRFIYSYFQPDARREVEVIKTRIQRKDNPDYWEPSRPLVSDGMEKMPDYNGEPGRTKTRWELMSKNVIFMDFRSEISAFDKYFYHDDLKQTLRHNSKQDYIRSKSKHLKMAAKSGAESKKMYRGAKEQIEENYLLPEDQLREVSEILGKKYSSIRVIKHRFFGKLGESVILGATDLEYSEAFAGSGEFAVVMLVSKVSRANTRTLIILDEPEVSLHPGAQERLVSFLKEEVKKNKHQIVLGTHSPFIIKSLPADAIKTLYSDPSTKKIRATQTTLPDEAFFHLGMETNTRKTIFVEDKLAAELVRKALRKMGEAIYQAVTIKYLPGGASVLLGHYLPAYAVEERADCLFLMDGDQRPKEQEPLDIPLEAAGEDSLDHELKRILGCVPEFKTDGGKGGPRPDQLLDAKRKTIQFASTFMGYLPGASPESFVWNNIGDKCGINELTGDGQVDFKGCFRELTRKELGKEDFEKVSSDEIFDTQKRYLTSVKDELFDEVKESIQSFLNGD